MEPIIKSNLELISLDLDNNNKPRLLFCLPQSAGDIFLSTALLPSLKEAYPNHDIYYACLKQFFDILQNNPYVYKTIEYNQIMADQPIMEGTGDWDGLFDISFFVPTNTQLLINYLNHGKTNILLNLRRNNASN